MNIFRNDAYQLTMLYAHWKSGHASKKGTAEAYFRKYPHPDDQNMVVMAGAFRINEMVNSDFFHHPFAAEDLPFIQNHILKISDAAFEPFGQYLLDVFPQELAEVEILCAQDGEVLYPDFPVVQTSGTLGAVHMLETPILSILNSTVRAATVARRIRRAAGYRVKLLDFATRRQDDEQAVHTAVASAIGGFDGTSNMDAARRYNIPCGGTMAHAYVLSYGMDGELDAFKDFLKAFPDSHVLLVDTYDIMQGLAKAIRASMETKIPLRGIRLDSPGAKGWSVTLGLVRETLNLMGCRDTKIVVSGDYDEKLIAELQKSGAYEHIDVIGIGSRLGCPDFASGFVYKVVEVDMTTIEIRGIKFLVDGKPVMKLAGAKSSLPCKKVWIKNGKTHHLLPFTEEWLRKDPENFEEEILQVVGGPLSVTLEYIQEARNLTQNRVFGGDPQFMLDEVRKIAASIHP